MYQAEGDIQNGTFEGRWHFSFGEYYDPRYKGFGILWVFNDDTLSPGAVRPLHPHRDIEVVTYCAAGESRHADQRGEGGVSVNGKTLRSLDAAMIRTEPELTIKADSAAELLFVVVPVKQTAS